MNITLGFSSCPNDTYIFDALVHKRIDTKGIDFSVHMADVEELNLLAFSGKLDVTKLSYHAFAHTNNMYQILDSGSALGFGNGPLFITKNGNQNAISENSLIALPGKNTTANLLFSIAYPKYKRKEFIIFSDIENAINSGRVDAGVIIHENRFTYAERGFYKLQDLGDFWERTTNAPIPLGAITVKRSLPHDVKQTINELIRESIEYAIQNPLASKEYISCNAQEISEEITEKHIALFVNDFSLDLGSAGKQAIITLFEKAHSVGIIPKQNTEEVFLNK